ncbi:hypothetical protein [Salipaludibacillus aurantiacus]|uniref:Uncharacterized protein n=1 Tax=Salipaludibacillus aurantiacus TaxID=1601833 RepID=A0A1H9U236_9BACI|nr:hypothetical protein [Salipaludibacillus aurantiacus]SES03318.1 hypothetical protein SAMN05518684_106241 [Salipaludibacillus aurantiacus]
MHIKRWDMWVKLADAPAQKIDDKTYKIAVFDNVKHINGKKYGLFSRFITISREEMEEDI